MQSCRQNQEKDLRSCGSDVKRTRVAELPCNVVPSSEQAALALALSIERREGSGCGRFASLATGAKASYFQLTSRAGHGLQRIPSRGSNKASVLALVKKLWPPENGSPKSQIGRWAGRRSQSYSKLLSFPHIATSTKASRGCRPVSLRVTGTSLFTSLRAAPVHIRIYYIPHTSWRGLPRQALNIVATRKGFGQSKGKRFKGLCNSR